LGTSNTLVYLKGQGIVINEPSVVAVNIKTNQILAVGTQAKEMLGRTPGHIKAIRPLVDGVISDFEVTEEMLSYLINKADKMSKKFARPRVLIGVPSGTTNVETRAVYDAARSAGAREVILVEEPMAAAIGVRLPIKDPVGSMIIDIGGGTTDIAVISMGGTVVSRTLKIAGDRFNDDIMRFIRDEFQLAIGEATAEFTKIAVGSAIPLDERLEIPVRGRDMATGLPREVSVKNTHARVALAKSLRSIVDAIHETIEVTPPELAGDVLRHGITLCGGGALLRGLGDLIERETGVQVTIAQDPLTCVIRGLGQMIDDFDSHREFLDNPLKPLSISL